MFQKLILTGSAKSSNEISIEPSSVSRKLFEQKNLSEAKAFLHHKLCIESNLPIYISSGMATTIYTIVMFCYWYDTPSNFSLFLMPDQSVRMMPNTSDIIALSLKSSDGRGGFDSENIKVWQNKRSTFQRPSMSWNIM